ncbi:MAG: CdaR family protein, partial [Chloroflexota bacterium]
TKELPITLNLTGSLPIGYQAEEAVLGVEQVLISGPQSIVETVSQVTATVDMDNVIEDLHQTIDLVPTDSNGVEVAGVSLDPASISVDIPITQLGGYRNVWVTVVTYGQVAQGYRLRYYFAFPPTVTIFSTDPDLVNNIPGYVETTPINLNGANEDFEINITLNLPEGVSIIGDQTITVQVVIAPIESSLNFTNVPIIVIGLADNLIATVSPDVVDVFLSGPLYLLEELTYSDIIVILDLTDRGPGTYQLIPRLELLNEKIKVDAILPGMIKVIITKETSP